MNKWPYMNKELLLLWLCSTLLVSCTPTAVNETSDSDDLNNNNLSTIDQVWLTEHNNRRELINDATVQDDGTNGTYPAATQGLPTLVWNNKLAEVAENYAQQCNWGHNANRQADYLALGGENISVGENIAAHYFSTPSGTIEEYAAAQVELWWAEHTDWHYQAYDQNTINGAGHFTQIIWANTIEVGCAMVFCEDMYSDGIDGYYGVCNYGPAGNYISQFPYETANP